MTSKLDHKNLNMEVDFLSDTITTAENIAVKIFEEIAPEIAKHNCQLHCVKLVETENNFVEYFG